MPNKNPKFKVVYRPLDQMKPLENNPRWIKKEDFERLCASVQNNPELFEAQPIILSNRTGENVIIAGNQRYRAAIEVGLKEVPTILLEGLTEAKEKEIIIRTNVTNGKWDFDVLASGLWGDVDELTDWGVEGVNFMYNEGDAEIESNLDDLQVGGFQNELREGTNLFQISFVFPLDKKEEIDEFIKKNGKEYIVNKIVELCCNNIEDENGDNAD